MVEEGNVIGGINKGYLRSAENQLLRIEELLKKAYREAERRGRIVGWVSRFGEVRVEENSVVRFYIDPSTYYANGDAPFQRIGDYLAIVDPKDTRLVLLRVKSIVRKDELAVVGIEPPISPIINKIEPRSLITGTLVEGELIMEMSEGEPPRPASKSIEPQSPVIDPNPEVLAQLLDLPREGVVMGSLSTHSTVIKNGDIVVRLPISSLFHHLLILGTTGSGKTTLIKNMILSLYNIDHHPVSVIIDLNQDFIQLPLKNDSIPIPKQVFESCYKDLKPIEGVVVVLPIAVGTIYEKLKDKPVIYYDDIIEAVRGVVQKYFIESLSPLMNDASAEFHYRNVNKTMIFETSSPIRLVVIPYFINTTNTETDKLSPLLPGLTSLSRDLVKKIREGFKRRHGLYPPMQVLYGALSYFIERGGFRQEVKVVSEDDLSLIYDYLRPYMIGIESYSDQATRAMISTYKLRGTAFTLLDAIKDYVDTLNKSKFHRQTIEALYRRVSSLMESGIIDVLILKGKEFQVLDEPNWPTIIEVAETYNLPVVVDLKWSMEEAGLDTLRIITYRTLDNLITWKHKSWAQRIRTPHIVVSIDEAHQFFQNESKNKDEIEAIRQVSSMISKIARLGRARGVGLIFSTHAPNDLNDIIIQLTNTKIILRTEKRQIENISVPREVLDYLPRLQDRMMLIQSHVFREGYIFAQTTTPLTAHYDISAYLDKR
ncbi:MAG: DUF87 domain-containing protein [Caldisphaeraceae archaeon]|nr:DUF87 domain-containing protein [Caldisphaeraceae archaeon]MEB3797794.1 DUF87 domain-containing protein [Caldisphaeraceae archaeon]